MSAPHSKQPHACGLAMEVGLLSGKHNHPDRRRTPSSRIGAPLSKCMGALRAGNARTHIQTHQLTRARRDTHTHGRAQRGHFWVSDRKRESTVIVSIGSVTQACRSSSCTSAKMLGSDHAPALPTMAMPMPVDDAAEAGAESARDSAESKKRPLEEETTAASTATEPAVDEGMLISARIWPIRMLRSVRTGANTCSARSVRAERKESSRLGSLSIHPAKYRETVPLAFPH